TALGSTGWGRSELAAQLYDEILFHGATFADLEAAGGPVVAVGATELSSGARVVFLPQNFDIMCADLGSFRLARAAAASSAGSRRPPGRFRWSCHRSPSTTTAVTAPIRSRRG